MRTLLRDGDSSGIVRELKRKMKAKNDRSVYEFKAAATDSRPISERTLDISVNGSGGFNNISCVAKIFPSPDFFVGLQPMGINLYNAADGFFVAEHTGDLIGRDGGIDRSSDYEGKDPVPDEETLKIRPLVIISAPYGTYKIVAITPSPQPGIPVPTIMSTNPPAEPSTTSAICVDANALAHLPRHRLRYLNHMMAPVLCDASGSCATPGHMVIFRETAMMMHSYCALVPCSTRTILVNSPRYSRAVRLSTRTHALYFTAFAARYVTHTEENMFALAVRIGL